MMSVIVNPAAVRRLYVVVGFINTLLLGVFGLILLGRLAEGIVTIPHLDPAHQLNLQAEGLVIAVWYSSTLLLLTAAVAVINYWSDKSTRSSGQERWWGFRYGWLLLACGTLYLSIDESTQIHEGLALWAVQEQGVALEGLTSIDAVFGWLLVLAPVFLLGALLLLGFFLYWLTPTPRARLLAIMGMCCWTLVPVLELVESRLIDTFGSEGTIIENFFEESLEITGVTLLLMATMEYLVARSTPVEDTQAKKTLRPGRRAIFAGVATPLLLIPLAGLGTIVDTDLREELVHLNYRLSAARIARAMDVLHSEDNWLIVSGGCDTALIEKYLPLEMHAQGSLLSYPDGVQSMVAPNYSLAVLELDDEEVEPPEHLPASLKRIAIVSKQLWYLRCGDASNTDLAVERWLSENSSDVECLSLPGVPSLVLTRVTPTVSLPPVDVRYRPCNPTVLAEDQIELLGCEWFVDRHGADTVLHVTLLWRSLMPIKADYHVFVHLTDQDGKLLAQKDGVPMRNRYPFSQWKPGEVVVDSYDVLVPSNLPSTGTEIRLGLYDFETGLRLCTGESDHFKLRQSGQMPTQ